MKRAALAVLAAAALLVPVLLVLGVWLNRAARGTAQHAGHNGARKLAVPWFALGFLALVIVNSLRMLPETATHAVNTLDTFALTMAMTALGIETRVSQIRQAGPRALTAGFLIYLWLVGGGLAITWGVERLFG